MMLCRGLSFYLGFKYFCTGLIPKTNHNFTKVDKTKEVKTCGKDY